MDRLERLDDVGLNFEEVLRLLIDSILSRVWTSLPAVVQSFNASAMTVNAQLALNGQYTLKDGTTARLPMPVVLDCPVLWPGGGGCTLTWTPVKDDECLIVFASRCVDTWFKQGYSPVAGQVSTVPGVPPANPANDPPEIRMHNMSDGFALVGVRNSTRAYTPVAGSGASAMQLQTDDGEAYVQLDPITHAVNVVTPAAVSVTAASMTVTTSGSVNINGAVISSTGEITDALGKVVGTHKHTGVQTGGGVTGPPQ